MKTNEEIVKGIECCTHRCYAFCEKCPYHEIHDCKVILIKDIKEHFSSLSLVRSTIDEIAQDYEKIGSEKAWEVARKIFLVGRPDGMSDRDFQGMFNGKGKEAVLRMDFKDVIDHINRFDELRKRYEAIKPGAIIKHNGIKKMVTCVRNVSSDFIIHAIDYKGETTTFPYDATVQLTGAHIDVGDFLKLLS